MEKQQTKPMSCVDVSEILKALKNGSLNNDEAKIFEEYVFKKVSLHIADCDKCLVLAEELFSKKDEVK